MEILLDRESTWHRPGVKPKLVGFFNSYDDQDSTNLDIVEDSGGELSLRCSIVSGKNLLRMSIPVRAIKDGFSLLDLYSDNPLSDRRVYVWENLVTGEIKFGNADEVPINGAKVFLVVDLGTEFAHNLRIFILESSKSLIEAVTNYYHLYGAKKGSKEWFMETPERILVDWDTLLGICETWGKTALCSSEFDGNNFIIYLEDREGLFLRLVLPFRVVSKTFTSKIHLGVGFSLPAKGVLISYGKDKFVPGHYLCNGILENQEKFRFYIIESSRSGRTRKVKDLVI